MSISSILSTAVSSLLANSSRVATGAHNIANVNTDGYLAQESTSPGVIVGQAFGSSVVQVEAMDPSDVNIGKEFADMMVAKAAYEASAMIVKRADEMLKEATDIKA